MKPGSQEGRRLEMVKRFLCVVALAAAVIPLSAGAPENVKLSTLVPAGTSWHKALLDMGNSWNKDTGGRVTLTVFAGGQQGDEATAIKKMRTDVLQASFLSNVGLVDVDEGFNVLSMPFFIETPEEEAAIEKKLAPVIEKRLEAKGYHLLCWGSAGWLQVFSKKPLKSLADVKSAKLYTTKGADKWYQWYVSNGFHPVPLLPSDVPTQLKLGTGLIDTAPYPPYLAMTLRVFDDAKYMLDLKIAPLTGALLISQASWNRISADDRAKMTAAAQALETRVRSEAPAQDAESVRVMKTRGLQVTALDPKALGEFRSAADQLVKTMRGSMVPADIYDLAVQERDAFRKSQGK
jgi:TRAP-type C4-dicarboxylate transport system substrate-binding protein